MVRLSSSVGSLATAGARGAAATPPRLAAAAARSCSGLASEASSRAVAGVAPGSSTCVAAVEAAREGLGELGGSAGGTSGGGGAGALCRCGPLGGALPLRLKREAALGALGGAAVAAADAAMDRCPLTGPPAKSWPPADWRPGAVPCSWLLGAEPLLLAGAEGDAPRAPGWEPLGAYRGLYTGRPLLPGELGPEAAAGGELCDPAEARGWTAGTAATLKLAGPLLGSSSPLPPPLCAASGPRHGALPLRDKLPRAALHELESQADEAPVDPPRRGSPGRSVPLLPSPHSAAQPGTAAMAVDAVPPCVGRVQRGAGRGSQQGAEAFCLGAFCLGSPPDRLQWAQLRARCPDDSYLCYSGVFVASGGSAAAGGHSVPMAARERNAPGKRGLGSYHSAGDVD
jgi:hypothetical protein